MNNNKLSFEDYFYIFVASDLDFLRNYKQIRDLYYYDYMKASFQNRIQERE